MMIDCKFCHSGAKESYLYTQCSHLICVDCVSTIWDQKYSVRCCDKTTYLDDDTCHTLLSRSREASLIYCQQSKQNANSTLQTVKNSHKKTFSDLYEEEKTFARPKGLLEESIVAREFQTPITHIAGEGDKKRDQHQDQMQRVLCEEVEKVKFNFQMCHKDLETREQIILKELYNRYSEHLSNLKATCSEQEVRQLKQKLNKVTSFESSLPQREEVRQDKILQKLDYNQQMMRQRLSKHYHLLK